MPLGVGDIPLTAVPGMMQGYATGNALIDSSLGNQIKGIQAQYAPLTTLSDAASKMAYANLMGPQFLAKLMGHPDVVANMTPDQRNNLPSALAGAGLGTGANGTLGNAFQQALSNVTNPQPNMLDKMISGLGNALGFGASTSSQSPNAMNNPPIATQQVNLPNMKPGDSYTNTSGANQSVAVPKYQGTNIQALPLTSSQPQVINPPTNSNSGEATYGERAGYTAGLKAEGEELGKERGQAISKLGDEYRQDSEAIAPLNHLMQLSQSPEFMNLRKDIPAFQSLQLQNLSKFGTPEQQRVIGDFITSSRDAVANLVKSFQGRAMAKEFDFANTMKINDNDTLGVILGKLEALNSFTQGTMQRNQVARSLMENQHMNEGDAYENANKQVNMDAIRKQVASQLPTPITIRNKKTGQTMVVTPSQWNDMLNQK